MLEAGIDRAVGCGSRSWPPATSCGMLRNDRCAAHDRPQVTVRGCAHRAQSTFLETRGQSDGAGGRTRTGTRLHPWDLKSRKINNIRNATQQLKTTQNNQAAAPVRG